MAAVTLQLLKKAAVGWDRDGPEIRYADDDTRKTARERAVEYAEQWVAKDPANRQYNIFDGPA